MTQWYVKELSKLTRVTVQTLHHYDRIGLLKPSVRLSNGYRLYSEKDLLRLQQIIALKFFGFELSQIKNLLSMDINMIDHFSAQSALLDEKAKTLFNASEALKKIISVSKNDKSIPWETIIQIIEVYHMTQALEKTWAGKIFTSDELKKYAEFEKKLQTRFSTNEQQALHEEWENIVHDVNTNLDKDPASQVGISIGKRCMDWVNHYYGEEYVAIRNTIWVNGFGKGQITDEDNLSPASFTWLDNAISAYYRDRIKAILSKIGKKPDDILRQEWKTLLTEMHGNEHSPKNDIFNAILKRDDISGIAKTWIKEYMNKYSCGK